MQGGKQRHDSMRTLGMRPLDRFGLDLNLIRHLHHCDFNEELFFLETTRKVRIDNTFNFRLDLRSCPVPFSTYSAMRKRGFKHRWFAVAMRADFIFKSLRTNYSLIICPRINSSSSVRRDSLISKLSHFSLLKKRWFFRTFCVEEPYFCGNCQGTFAYSACARCGRT